MTDLVGMLGIGPADLSKHVGVSCMI